jgi:hypothetical protein
MIIPDFMKNYFSKIAEKYISATPSNKIEIEVSDFPDYKGKSFYEASKNISPTVYWSGSSWLSSDLLSSQNYNRNKKIENVDREDYQIILNAFEKIKGSIDFSKIASKISGIQNNFFSKVKDLREDLKKEIDKINNSQKEDSEKSKSKKDLNDKHSKEVEDLRKIYLARIAKETELDSSSFNSRESVLEDIYKKFGKDIALDIKLIILGESDKEDMVKALKSKVKLKSDPKEEYIPEKDEGKERFNKKDQYYVLKQIIENKEAGLQGVIKNLRKFYNETLINEILLAARYYGGIDGLVEYFSDYDIKRKNLRLYGQEFDTPSDIKGITKVTNDIRSFLNDLKKEHKTNYIGSIYEDLEEVVDIIQKYQRSKIRNLEFENELLNLFGVDGKLLKRLRKTKLPFVTDVEKLVGELQSFFSSSQKFEVPLQEAQKNKNKKKQESDDSDYLKSIKKIINESSDDLSEEDEKISEKFFQTYKENLNKLKNMDLSEQEILQRKKEFEDYKSKDKKLKEWLKMTPEERLKADEETSLANFKKRVIDDYNKYWSKMSPTERDEWVKKNNLPNSYVQALNNYGAQLAAKSIPTTKKKTGPKKQVVLSPEEQAALENLKQKKMEKQVKSSYVIEKIEKTSSKIRDPLISAELYDIAKELKKLL